MKASQHKNNGLKMRLDVTLAHEREVGFRTRFFLVHALSTLVEAPDLPLIVATSTNTAARGPHDRWKRCCTSGDKLVNPAVHVDMGRKLRSRKPRLTLHVWCSYVAAG